MKLFNKLHVADILWMILIVVLIFGAVQFSNPREVSAQTGDTVIRYTVELGDRLDGNARRVIREGFHENIRIGEPVFSGLTGVYIGTIVDVYALPLQIESFDEANNIIRRADVDGLEYVYIVIEAPAQITYYETLIGSFSVSVGREAFVRSRYFAGAGYVVAMERVN